MKIHMVKKGDTLYELSKKYGISLEKLIEANPQLKDPNKLNIGEKVKIPTESISAPMPEHIIHKHVVKQGDSLWQLSKAWGVTLREMIDANPQLKNPNALLVGEIVNIPKVGMKEVANGELVGGNANHNKTTPGGKTYTGPKVDTSPIQTLPPVIPQLPPIHDNMPLPNVQLPNVSMPSVPMPNASVPNPPAPNIAPIQHIPPHHVPMPLPELPIVEEKIEMKQHLYIQYTVPTQEAVEHAPEKSNPCPQVSEQMCYPGITEGYSWNQLQCEQPAWEHQGYGQQPNWVQPQFTQPSYPMMPHMVHEGTDHCNPNISPYGTSFAGGLSGYGGENQGLSPLSNNMAPLSSNMAPLSNNMAPPENVSVSCSNVYSCISPYDWTFPNSMMHGQGVEHMGQHPNMFGYSQPEAQVTHDCGCHSREGVQESSDVGDVATISEKAVIGNDVSNSTLESSESISVAKLKKAKTSSVNTGKGRAVNQGGDKKQKNKQQKRRNPWIKK
ncbi:LysM peptidoglycan-binding domain-containing protein [Paenibacillus macquariensis]|uniref:LysM domain-containing protein n=1 Tax=Paenibacillus macquariensis TaxID=948756 RepID=A0ABY1JTH0_9BACL|nr:LysM peptidoglycan-binding domain-containing protein [Paenibacillus macquariensis]MEC0093134.1 LysM peptidoglycan-binding domain-containing protein [Paenibacillus macquariensis]OAB36475.1 hypothetical protein PMSM_08560 [Paenibacillus macquariensis subsp. macquariensis]SIQ73397.1 LysM domain-containing protein [Paenibacillus macquariensis]